jgi:hypothetical protein
MMLRITNDDEMTQKKKGLHLKSCYFQICIRFNYIKNHPIIIQGEI